MKSLNAARTYSLAAVAIFSTSMVSPAASARKQPKPQILRLDRPAQGEWFGIYMMGKKAGYAFTHLEEGMWQNKKAIVSTSEVTLRVAVAGKEIQRTIREKRYYEYKNSGRLLAFRFEHQGDGGHETRMGNCTVHGVTLQRIRPGRPVEIRELPATAEVVELADAPRWALHTGKKLTGFTLDLEETLADRRTVTTPQEKTDLIAGGLRVPVFSVETFDEKVKIRSRSFIDAQGRVLETQFGQIMTAKAENEKTAKLLDHIDLFTTTRVVIESPISTETRKNQDQLHWIISGIDGLSVPENSRQKWEKLSDGTFKLVVTRRSPSHIVSRPVSIKEDLLQKKALRSNLLVESDDPAIVRFAQQLIGKESNSWKAAQKINQSVFRTLQKEYGSSNDRATDVLAAKKGDCTEHSLLMTALARAAGIPARRIDGLVYMEAADKVPAFYWHQWVEVYVGEWIAMDPTFGQNLADATHIALGSEGGAQTANFIHQMHIKRLFLNNK